MADEPRHDPARDADPDREARLANIRWFSRLSPSEKIRAMEMHNRATRRLRQLRGDRG